MRTELRVVLLALTLSVGACKCQGKSETPPATQTTQAAVVPPAAKCVPKILVAHQGTPTIDGDLDEPVWHAAAATEPFLHEKANRVVPHTEARAAWDEQALYVALYVADADLTSSDQVRVELEGGGTVDATPEGTFSCHFGAQTDCAAAGVVGKLERDGDVDSNKEEDEEWIAELKIPWTLLGGRQEHVAVNFSRVETLDGKRLREVWSRGCGEIQVQ